MAAMSKDEREAFLAKPHVGVIAVDHPGQAPLAIPIWYRYAPGGDVAVLTHPDSVKAKLIESAGRFSICVQSEHLPYKYVMVEGPVVETRPCDVEADARPMAHRYLGESMGNRYIEDGDDSSSVLIVMRPERWYTVDYGKTSG